MWGVRIQGILMGFKFRKRIKIAPGVKLNITSKGISSVSVGGKGATLNVGKKGVKSTLSIPGTGLSYSEQANYSRANATFDDSNNSTSEGRRVGFWLGLGCFLLPFIFVWLLLRSGHSRTSRIVGFSWLTLYVIANFLPKS